MPTAKQNDYGMPVYNLQKMLRSVFQVHEMMPEVVPDGSFGETTETAVKVFQEKMGLPVSGIADAQTWDALSAAYEAALLEGNAPVAVSLFTTEDFEAPPQSPRARLLVLQAMLQVLHKRFINLPSVELTGVRDAQTDAALDDYRRLFGLEAGDGPDKRLWYHLAKAYESAVLPHDFENPENNQFIPEQARQMPDDSVRTAQSMPAAMPDAQLAPAQEINLLPQLDSYAALQKSEDAPLQAPAPEPMQKRARRPIKWSF